MHEKLFQEIVERWITFWNERELVDFMSLFSEEIIHSSKLISQVLPGQVNYVRGKKLLKDYWAIVKQRYPNLKFNLVAYHHFYNRIVLFVEAVNGEMRAIVILTVNENLLIEKSEVSFENLPSDN